MQRHVRLALRAAGCLQVAKWRWGPGMAAEPKSSHFETRLRRLCSPEVLMQTKITESHLTEAQTPPR